MDHSPAKDNDPEVLIRLARKCFLQSLCNSIPELDRLLVRRFEAGGDASSKDNSVDVRLIPEWLRSYMQHRRSWAQNLLTIWRAGLVSKPDHPPPSAFEETSSLAQLSLISNDAIEGMIASSRLNTRVLEVIEPLFTQLRKRLLSLDPKGLANKDLLQPLAVAQSLMDAWSEAKLDQRAFVWVMDGVAKEWGEHMLKAYEASNALLQEKGIQPYARPTPSPTSASAALASSHPGLPHSGAFAPSPAAPIAQPAAVLGPATHLGPPATAIHQPFPGALPNPPEYLAPQFLAPQMVIPGGYTPSSATVSLHTSVPGQIPVSTAPMAHMAQLPQLPQPSIQQIHALWADIRQRLEQVVGPGHKPTPGNTVTELAPSVELMDAMQAQVQAGYVQKLEKAASHSALIRTPAEVSAEVAQLAKAQSESLKQEAARPNEKAIIEMVALMFQSVIAEDRVPASVRVLFARLQVPVLRIALTDNAFFSDEAHPARRLIDRMGSAAMGFDGANFQGSSLEMELSRIVQMIEQYPDTGIKVFQLALNEFEKFLQQFLAETRQAGKAMSVAQQVEEKETLLVKFTIELRTMLQDLPIQDDIRAFLFKTWAEVLAVSAVRAGAQSPQTQRHKHTAALLIWALSGTSDAVQRKRVAQALPGLRARLRAGMAMVGVTEIAQEAIQTQIIQSIQNTFLTHTEGLSMARLEQIAARLKGLENLVSEGQVQDIALSPENLEMMTGLELTGLVVIEEPVNTGVSDAVVDWAKNRAIGEWFYLAPKNAKTTTPTSERKTGPRVQYAWHSAQRHLHLLLMPDGRSLLMKLKTFAVCIEQGQLIPLDQEGLMLRATREALNQFQPSSVYLMTDMPEGEMAESQAHFTHAMAFEQPTKPRTTSSPSALSN